jgi:hypothetical protein
MPQTIAQLESDVHTVREAIFELSSAARRCAPHDFTQLHVSLQLAANELGLVERMLHTDRARQPVAVSGR